MDAESAYLFRHALLRDAAYELQLPQNRGELHALAYEIMMRIHWPDPQEFRLGRDGEIEVDPAAPALSVLCELAEHAGFAASYLRSEQLEAVRSAELNLLFHAAYKAEQSYQMRLSRDLWLRIVDHPRASPVCVARALMGAGNQTAMVASVDKAIELLERAVQLAEQSKGDGGAWVVSAGKNSLATQWMRRGNLEKARKLWQEAADDAKRMGRMRGYIGSTSNLLTTMAGSLSEDEILARLHEFHERSKTLKDKSVQGYLLSQLVQMLVRFGRFDELEEQILAGLELARRIRDPHLECSFRMKYSNLLSKDPARFTQAQREAQLVKKLAASTGDRRRMVGCAHNLSDFALREGDLARAEQYARESIALNQEIGDKRGLSMSLSKLALVYSESRDERAIPTLEEATRVARETSDYQTLAAALNNHGTALWRLHRLEEASARFHEALQIAEQQADARMQNVARGNLAVIRLEGFGNVDARACLNVAIDSAERFRDHAVRRLWMRWLAVLLVREGEWDRAREVWDESALVSCIPSDSEQRAWELIQLAADQASVILDWNPPPA